MDILKDIVHDLIVSYRMPQKYCESIADNNMRRINVMCVVAILVGSAITGTGVILEKMGALTVERTRLYFFMFLIFAGIIYGTVTHRLWRSSCPYKIKTAVAYSVIIVGMISSTVYSFMSENPLNGYMAFCTICILFSIYLNIDPFVFLAFMVTPVILMSVKIYMVEGRSTVIDSVILSIIIFLTALFRRRNSKGYKEQTSRLVEVYERSKAADAAKSSFLANMSHEIRTPINVIMGMNEMVLREELKPEIRDYSLHIQKASSNLLSLINDILDFSKIEAGKLEIHPAEYDIASLLNDCYSMIIQRAEDKKLGFKIVNNPDMPRKLYGDELRIRQIILNLLTNAVKYTEYGSVTMTVDYLKKMDDNIRLLVRVEDTGVGIDETQVSRLFDSFIRVEEDKYRTIEGTGLGLAIVKRLCTAQNGMISVSSTPGEGSIFEVEIPQRVIDNEPIGDFQKQVDETYRRNSVYKERFHAPNARILMVDDVKMNLDVFKALLKSTEMKIDMTLSGERAVELAKNVKYDIIFVDIMMPQMTGEEVFDHIRLDADSLNRETPLVALTANAVKGAKEKYLEMGFDEYLPKPINSALLEGMIISLLPLELLSVEEVREEDNRAEMEEMWLAALPKIEGIEWNEAYSKLESMDVLMEAVANACRDAERTADVIRNHMTEYLENDDLSALGDYRIKVHALKSSAGTIGAFEIQLMAARLEEAAKKSDKNYIEEKTEEALEKWVSTCNEIAVNTDIGDMCEDCEEIDNPEYIILTLGEIAEAMEDFNVDVADEKMRELAKYKFSAQIKELFVRLKEAVEDIDDEETRTVVECIISAVRSEY